MWLATGTPDRKWEVASNRSTEAVYVGALKDWMMPRLTFISGIITRGARIGEVVSTGAGVETSCLLR